MELWFIYIIIRQSAELYGTITPSDPTGFGKTLLACAIVAVGVSLAFFILQGFALYKIAKKRGIRYKALAFVPFANIMLMGRFAGDATFFGQKIKRAGLYAMIAQITVTAIAISYIVADVYLHCSGCINYEVVDETFEQFRPIFAQGTHFDKMLFRYYDDVVYLLNMIFNLLCEILMLVLLSALYRQYAPEKHMWLTVVTLIAPPARCIILFVVRNRRAVNYQEYMRAKRAEYMRRYQQYYGGNPYGGNPYGGNPYGGNPYGGNGPQGYGQTPPPQGQREEPFSEFSSNKKPEDPFSEFSSDNKGDKKGDEDDFFS